MKHLLRRTKAFKCGLDDYEERDEVIAEWNNTDRDDDDKLYNLFAVYYK